MDTTSMERKLTIYCTWMTWFRKKRINTQVWWKVMDSTWKIERENKTRMFQTSKKSSAIGA